MLRVAVAIVPEVRQLLREDPSQLEELMGEIHDEDLADLLGLLDEDEAAQVLKTLKAEDAADILERLDEDAQEAMVETIGVEKIAPIVSEMAADERTDLIEALPESVGENLLTTLERVDPQAAAEVEALAKWPEDSAGGLMTTAYVAVSADLTVADVIERIRKVAAEAETVYSIYAVDAAHRVIGVASLRDLLLAAPGARFSDVMTENVFAVGPDTDQEDVARTMAKYDFAALPVIGPDKKLLGVITFDDVMDVLTQEQTEDVQKIGAVEPLDMPYFQTSFLTFIRKRAVWLVILFVEEFFTQTALRYYDPVMEAVRGALLYVPLLISTGGNSGSQSSTLVIRGLAVGEIKLRDWWRILVREAGMGLVLGLIVAAIAFGRVLMYPDQHIRFAITVALTVIGIVIAGCTVGAMLPIVMKRVGVDPATSSTPFIASLVDTLGVIIYARVAMIVMSDVIAAAQAAAAAHPP
jgi:magnesium transporter